MLVMVQVTGVFGIVKVPSVTGTGVAPVTHTGAVAV